MHPQIKKFWGNRFCRICGTIFATDFTPEQSYTSWFVIGGGLTIYEYENGEIKYYYNGRLSSEEEILRMIKLKAFL